MGSPRGRLIAAFAVIYLVWGSTYLGIKVGLEGWPPFLMAGVRFLIAGAGLYAWSRWRSGVHPSPRAWGRALVTGGLLLLGGNGAVSWAQQWVPSGTAALLVASEPLWIVLLTAVVPGGQRPGWRSTLGVVLGFAGVAMIVDPRGGGAVDVAAAAVIVAGSLSWAIGSLIGRQRDGVPVALGAGMQMLAGGALLTLVSGLTGEFGRFDPALAWGRPTLGVLYLIVFGSLLGYTTYAWLLEKAPPSAVSSYAYVNPLVALLLGAWLAGEVISGRTLVGGLVVVAAVALVVTRRARRPVREGGGPRPDPEDSAGPSVAATLPGSGVAAPVLPAPTALVRVWRGRVPRPRAAAYEEYLEQTGLGDYRRTPGNCGTWLLRRDFDAEITEFVTVTLWQDWEAVRRFAGAQPERARYYPEDRDFLLDLPPTVDHFELVPARGSEETAGAAPAVLH